MSSHATYYTLGIITMCVVPSRQGLFRCSTTLPAPLAGERRLLRMRAVRHVGRGPIGPRARRSRSGWAEGTTVAVRLGRGHDGRGPVGPLGLTTRA